MHPTTSYRYLTPQQAADHAVTQANQNALLNLPPGSGRVAYIKPLQMGDVWRKAAQFGASVLWGGAVYLTMASVGVPTDMGAVVSGLVFMALSAPAVGRVGSNAVVEYAKTGTFQILGQLVGFAVKFGTEQGALFVDPTLSESSDFNAFSNEMPLLEASSIQYVNNTTGNCTINDPCWSENAGPWLSLAVIGIPFSLLLLNTLVPHRRGTTVFSACAARVEYDASTEPQGTRRRNRLGAAAIRYGAPVAVSAMVVGGVFVLGYSGQRVLMLRLLSVGNSVLVAARVRDFLIQLTDGIARGGADVSQLKDSGWRRKQIVSIPKSVLDELRNACGDDEVLYGRAKEVLEHRYWKLFWVARCGSMVSYGLSSAVGLYGMRVYFGPPLKGAFAETFREAVANFSGALIGTAFNEGWEDASATVSQRLTAAAMKLPYEVKRGRKKGFLTKMKDNRETTSVLSMAPFLRHIGNKYSESTADPGTRKVTLSTDDKIEIHSGIRSFQNIATAICFTSGATFGGKTSFGAGLYALGVIINMLTHWRGNTVAQVLIPGREAELLFSLGPASAHLEGSVLVQDVDDDDSSDDKGKEHERSNSGSEQGSGEGSGVIVSRQPSSPISESEESTEQSELATKLNLPLGVVMRKEARSALNSARKVFTPREREDHYMELRDVQGPRKKEAEDASNLSPRGLSSLVQSSNTEALVYKAPSESQASSSDDESGHPSQKDDSEKKSEK